MIRHIQRATDTARIEVRPGLFAQILAGENLTVVRWEMQPGYASRTGIHSHDEHEQLGMLLSGTLEMQVGSEVVHFEPGDSYWLPAGTPHGDTRVVGPAPVTSIDVFSPPREDYVRALTSRGARPGAGRSDDRGPDPRAAGM
jgi:quercetin dioxygenase-like cupin family protein